eukprot:jgi/Tetstr1/448782/TSEL_036016.t1
MPNGEEPVVEPTLESMHANVKAQSTLLPQSGSVGAKSVSDEDDYLAVPELLQRAESGYEAIRPVSRVPGLFPLSTDLTNEFLKQDDRRLPAAHEEYLWMSCFGAHMAALFVAIDEMLPYVPAANRDFTHYLARARNHAEAIDKAFRFRLAFVSYGGLMRSSVCTVTKVLWTCCEPNTFSMLLSIWVPRFLGTS